MNKSEEDHLPSMLTLGEVAKVLRCSKAQTCNLTNGKVHGVPMLPSVKFGKRKIIRRQALLAWMKARETETDGN